uniref:Reverse transcriptase Ty1/copia-type domain-containing protein n=1 Tax=Solanum lycopersicum TaxID=4081 RepID=A0A3Q7I3X3_SOLLC
MLNYHTLDEVIFDEDSTSENTPTTEPTISSLEPNLHVVTPTNEYTTTPIESNVHVLDKILYKQDGVLISQRKFTLDLLKDFDSVHYKSTTSPLDPTEKLRLAEGKLLSYPTQYRKLVGKLNFLANTRMDIAYSVQHLSQFMQSPREPHLKAAYHVLRYLQHDPTLGVFINNKPDVTISAYCDSDWASCPDSRKSVSGYLVLMGDSPISWKSKKQPTVSLSSAEAEYRAIRQVVGEVVWLERLLGFNYANISNAQFSYARFSYVEFSYASVSSDYALALALGMDSSLIEGTGRVSIQLSIRHSGEPPGGVVRSGFSTPRPNKRLRNKQKGACRTHEGLPGLSVTMSRLGKPPFAFLKPIDYRIFDLLCASASSIG